MTAELVDLPENRNERDQARDLRERSRKQLDGVLLLMDEACRNGWQIQFQLGIDGFGRNVVQRLEVVKQLT